MSQISSTFPNEAIIQELADKVSIVFQQRIHRACDNWWVPIFSANSASSLGESDAERLLAVAGQFDPSKCNKDVCEACQEYHQPMTVDGMVEVLTRLVN